MLSRDVIGWRLLALTFIALLAATIPNLDKIESEWEESIDSSNVVSEQQPDPDLVEEDYQNEDSSNESEDNSSEDEFQIESADDGNSPESTVESDDLSGDSTPLKTVNLEQPEWILPATQIIVLTMMAIMAVGLLTSTATAIFASEGARFAILLAVMGPLLAITQRGEGGIFTRGRLLGFIEAHPGIHFSALRDALELGNGVTAHHIQILEKEGRVITWMDGRVRRFASSGVDQTRLQDIQNPVTGMQIAILQVLSESGALGIHTGELRTKLATSRQLLSYHMKQLSERNFVESSGRGRSLRWNLLEEGQKKLDNSTHLTNM
jgi:DNA-binding MarR family transcriptional regulator